jgi:hypothetical protein
MINKETQVYQFKITLMGITPQIWRRIQILGDNSFHDLHRAIQNAMGWDDCHLHQFEVMNPKIGEIDLIGDGHDNLDGCKIKISKYFTEVSQRAFYEYDFGDSWGHNIILEKKLPVTNSEYPICLAGKRACPPEDCGGIWGYKHLVEIMKNKRHKEYREQVEWLGGHFYAEGFNPKDVIFDKYDK